MVKDSQHLIVKKYLKGHSLVESNIKSFNNFIEKRIQEIVNEISEGIESDDFEINLGKISIYAPITILSGLCEYLNDPGGVSRTEMV